MYEYVSWLRYCDDVYSFLFFKQKTAYEMRISDWSSDVCSSDLNGEIYNFRELRAELEDRGHRFRTSGATEVIIAAWRQWGPDCLSRLNGMFAFAIHDHARGRLFLASDPLGVKPLPYDRLSDGEVDFSSALTGLPRPPPLRRRGN